MRSEIECWGNGAAVHLPRNILEQANLDVSSSIDIEVLEGKIVISAVKKTQRKISLPFSEADLLKGLGAREAHADELTRPSTKELGE